jgi:hypothetical protein
LRCPMPSTAMAMRRGTITSWPNNGDTWRFIPETFGGGECRIVLLFGNGPESIKRELLAEWAVSLTGGKVFFRMVRRAAWILSWDWALIASFPGPRLPPTFDTQDQVPAPCRSIFLSRLASHRAVFASGAPDVLLIS